MQTVKQIWLTATCNTDIQKTYVYTHSRPQARPIAQLNNSAPGIGNQKHKCYSSDINQLYIQTHTYLYIVYIELNVPVQPIKR